MNKQPHEWTYKQQDSEVEIGPVSESQFVELAKNGTIAGSTLVRSSTRTKNKWISPKRIPAVAKFIKQPSIQPNLNLLPPIKQGPTYKEVVASSGAIVNPRGGPNIGARADKGPSQPRRIGYIKDFKPLKSITLTWLLRATLITMAINALGVFCLALRSRSELPTIATVQIGANLAQFFLYTITGIFFLRWKYQAYANLQAARSLPLKTSAGWTIAHYFIPFLNLYRPAYAMNEIQSRSKGSIVASILGWWILLTLASVFGNLSGFASHPDQQQGRVLSFISICLTIGAGYLLLKIVRTVTEKQRRYGFWLEKLEQPSNKNLAHCSIDTWQDDQPVAGVKLDNPIWGGTMMFCTTFVLAVLLPNSKQNSSARRFPSAPSFPSDDRAITHEANSRGSDAQQEESTTALITKLIESSGCDFAGRDNSVWVRAKLWKKGCDDTEIIRCLSSRLSETVDADEFQRIARHLFGYQDGYVLYSPPDVKRQTVDALAKAGQHVQPSQLKQMDGAILYWILKNMPMPEGTDLLRKLGSIGSEWDTQVAKRLYESKSDLAPEICLDIARETNSFLILHYLDKESAPACQFLWEGKLAGKKNFSRENIGRSEASIKAFTNVVAAKIESDPNGTVDALMACWKDQDSVDWEEATPEGRIERESLPIELLQKIDDALAANVKKLWFMAKGDTNELRDQARFKGTGPLAFLKLAKHLGGRKTVVAIAETGLSKPSVIKESSLFRDILLSVNEPESYDVIALAVSYHGTGESISIREKFGQAIEPSFLRQLHDELLVQPTNERKRKNWKPRTWTRRIENLVGVIEQIGTADSISALEELAISDNDFLKQLAPNSLAKIRERMGAD